MKEKHSLQKFYYRTASYFKHNSSTILTCIGAAGVVITAVTAVKATPKALKLLDDATDEKGEKLTKIETVLTAAPVYIPSIAMGASTIACIFGANALNKKQQAALTSAYALINNTHKEYRNKVKELLGEETDNQIQEAIIKDKRDEDITGYAPGLTSLVGSGEKCLFYEQYRDGYFEATMADVLNAEYHLNRNFALRGCVNLNEFYSFLGLSKTESGDVLGWGCSKLIEEYESPWIDFDHKKVTLEDGLECYIIETLIEPYVGHEEY